MTNLTLTEDTVSQVPALKLLMNMGWSYLSQEQALEARSNRTSNVLLEGILKEQLQKINSIQYKEREYLFSEANINNAIATLRDLPINEGFIAANKHFYELITLGKSFEQTIEGDKKSFSFRYIDWQNPANNVFHVTEEFSVLRSERTDHYRPDIVLFVNGIPMVVIECKSPFIKDPSDKAVEQQLRNQQDDGIRALYQYSNLTMALATNEAKYATTATAKEFWGFWKEIFKTKEEQQAWENQIYEIKHKPLPQNDRTLLFKERFKSVWYYFEQLEKEEQQITEQDKLLYSFCLPERLIDIMFNFTLFDEGIKKVARYQQYFAIKSTLHRVEQTDAMGKHPGGVIWHTQGSGKSLTMVMLAQLIAASPKIKNPKTILVTDRIDLDDQITETFQKCQVPVENAQTGKHLVQLIKSPGDAVITTLIHKFEAAVNQEKEGFLSPDIFVLIDEGHRSQYGTFNVKMQKVFPNACFIAFTGTPLMKKEKSTANKFGGLIDVYSITDAVADKAVVPLLYEGRHNLIQVNEKPLDNYFDKIAEPLTDYGKAALKRKYSSKNILNKADQVIYDRAWDISEHFETNWKGTNFKGQLVAPNKATAIRYKEYLDEIGKLTSEVIMSAPDMREGEEDAFEVSEDKVKAFWKSRMDKYDTAEVYEKTIINSFKKQDNPEIIIVVDKLLTGFDAPRNTVLYVTRPLKEHTLLQAIARVNRLCAGKDYGYIIDYFGNLENLHNALETYSGDNAFDAEDIEGTWTNIGDEIKKLPQAHSEVWDIFKTIKNKYDEPAYEELLRDEALRHDFYEKVSVFLRILKMALSSYDFATKTDEKIIEKYKKDAKFFLALRVSVKRRYSDDIDYAAYEPQVQKLIDKHITTEGEILKITEQVNIFDKQKREEEVEKLSSKAAKADHIASRTIRAINIKMNEDPVFYKKLSRLIKEAIDEYRQQRIDETLYLIKAKELEEAFLKGQTDNVPTNLKDKPTAIAIYNLLGDVFSKELEVKTEITPQLAEEVDNLIKEIVFDNGILRIDWQKDQNIESEILRSIDDYFFEAKMRFGVDFSFDKIDQMVEETIKMAKLKFV